MILKYILNKIRYPVKKNNLDKTVKNKNNRWLYMVYLHNDTYQVQVDCDGMSNECHVILLYFLSGLRFKAATYIKMLGNCGQALDSGDVSVKAVHFSSNKYHIIQFHYIYQDVGKLLSSPGLRGCFLHFPVELLPHE